MTATTPATTPAAAAAAPDTAALRRLADALLSGECTPFNKCLCSWAKETRDAVQALLDALATAERERDAARAALRDPDAATGCADDALPGTSEDWRAALAALAAQPPASAGDAP